MTSQHTIADPRAFRSSIGGREVARVTIEEPTLEEAYLAFMAARGRAEAALEEEDAS